MEIMGKGLSYGRMRKGNHQIIIMPSRVYITAIERKGNHQITRVYIIAIERKGNHRFVLCPRRWWCWEVGWWGLKSRFFLWL